MVLHQEQVPEDVIVIISRTGDIKRIPKKNFKIQHRKGVGVKTLDSAILTGSTTSVSKPFNSFVLRIVVLSFLFTALFLAVTVFFTVTVFLAISFGFDETFISVAFCDISSDTVNASS